MFSTQNCTEKIHGTHLLRVHLPGIANRLVYDCTLPHSKRCLNTTGFDKFCITYTERESDETNVCKTERGIWGFGIGPVEGERGVRIDALVFQRDI